MTTSSGRRRDERHLARLAARRLRVTVGTARAFTAILPLALVGWGTYELLGPGRFWLVALVTVVLVPLASGMILSLWSRPAAGDEGFGLNVVGEPQLHQHLAEIAGTMDVRAPGEVRVLPGAVVEMRLRRYSPVLHVGAAAMWHLDVLEFDRLVARELSMLRCLRGTDMQATWAVIERVDIDRLLHDRTPLAGPMVRRLGRRLLTLRQGFDNACREWAEAAVPRMLRTEDSDRAELQLADDAWRQLVSQWVEPMHGQGVALTGYAAATRHIVQAREEAGLVQRAQARREHTPLHELLSNAPRVDAAFSTWFNKSCGLPIDDIVAWSDYPNRVALPAWTHQARAGFATIAATTDRSIEPTLHTLLDAMEASEAEVDLRSLVAAARLALLQTGEVTLEWNWLAGPCLTDDTGAVIDVEAGVATCLDSGGTEALRGWFQAGDIGLDTPLLDPVGKKRPHAPSKVGPLARRAPA